MSIESSKIEEKTDFWHVRNRAEMYMDSIRPVTTIQKVFNSELDKIVDREITYVPGLNKVISEILDNSIDAAIRSNFKVGNKIKVKLDSVRIEICDNGTGIDVDSLGYITAYQKLKAGSNFSDKDRKTVGLNGVGAGITLFTSTYMKVTSVEVNGKRGVFEYHNESGEKANEDALNNIKHKEDIAPKSISHGVTVEWTPDLEFFHSTEISQEQIDLVYTRLINLAYTFPQIEFQFNGKIVKARDFKSYLKYYTDYNIILHEDDSLSIAVFPSEDGYQCVHSANGLNLVDGGSISDYISNSIVSKFTEKFPKSYKIGNSDTKNKLGFVIILRNMINLRFTSQSKTKLSNTMTELGLPTLNYTDIATKLYASKPIKDPIVELHQIKAELEKRKARAGLKAEKEEIFDPSISHAHKEKLFLAVPEGKSASTATEVIFENERDYIGISAVKGKILNALKSTPVTLKKNKVVMGLVNSLGLGLEETYYKNIIFCGDQDADASHIGALLVAMIYTVHPNMLNHFYRLQTPLIGIYDKNDVIIDWYFDLNSYNKAVKEGTVKKGRLDYSKGVGSNSRTNLRIIRDTIGLEGMLVKLEYSPEECNKLIENWMNDNEENLEYRQKELQFKSFRIDNI